MSTFRRTAKHKERGGRKVMEVAGVAPPNKRKFEEDVKGIVEEINILEEKIKPLPSNATQQLGTEITKESGRLSEMEKARESKNAEFKAIEAKIKEVGSKHMEKKHLASDLLAGVRHKTENRHDEAVEKLENSMTFRRLSSSEEMKFKQEVEALRKSKERLGEWLAAKHEVERLKTELDELRKKRDVLYGAIRESRSGEVRIKDKLKYLRQELDEAKERKKISMAEKDEYKKKIEALHEKRKQLSDVFRAQELAYVAAVEQSKKEETDLRTQKRAQSKLDREKMKALSRDFFQKQQYEEKMSTCSTLISHLSKLSLATQTHPDTEEDHAPSSQGSFTPPLERAPVRAESDPSGSPSAYLLRRDREEMLIVPSATSLTRRKSKKEKRRNAPVAKVTKRLQLNATIFSQFSNLGLNPPNTFSEIPSVIAQLNDRLVYFESMVKESDPRLSREFLELVRDSGLGSSAPSEILDVADRYMEFTGSQEEQAQVLDPGLGATTPTSFKPSYCDDQAGSASSAVTSEDVLVSVGNGSHSESTS